jgi:hypothetical protein
MRKGRMNLWLLIPAVLSCVLVLVLLGRYNASEAEREWLDYRRGTWPNLDTAALQQQFEREGELLEHLVSAADGAASDDGAAYVSAACALVEGAAPDRIERLRALQCAARMSSAMAPVDPAPWAELRLPETRLTAGLGAAAHHLLVTVEERFALRVTVLLACVRLVVSSFRRTRDRLVETTLERLLPRVRGAASDWRVLDRDQLAVVDATRRAPRAGTARNQQA